MSLPIVSIRPPLRGFSRCLLIVPGADHFVVAPQATMGRPSGTWTAFLCNVFRLPAQPFAVRLPAVDRLVQLADSSRKVNVSANVPDILTRLQINAGSWQATLEKLITTTKYVGTYFGSTTRLNEAAAHRGIKYLKNVTGRETPLTSNHAG